MKRRITKVLCMLLTLSFVFSLAGCGNSSQNASEGSDDKSNAKKIQIQFWDFHSDAEKEFMKSLADQYNKENPNVEIVYQNFPQSDYVSPKLSTAFASNEGPDVFFMSPGEFLKYANSGAAMDLTPYFTDKIKADFLPSSLEAVTVDNKIMAVPFEVELLGLYYNKDMLKAANVEPPKTWSELVSATKTLTKDKVAGLILDPNKGYYENFNWYPFLWQGGGNVIDAASKKATFEGPAVENALKLWGDLVKAGAPSKISVPGGFDVSLLGGGQAAMQISGTWAVNTLEKTYPNANIGLVPLPLPDGGKAVTCAGGWKMMVNAKSPNAEEAAKFVMWAFAGGVENPLKWCTDVKFAYSPRKSVVDAGKDIYSKGIRKVFTDEIYQTAIGEPRYPSEIVDAVSGAIQDVMLNNGDPKAAAKTANDKIKQFLTTYEGSL